ncbi:type III secretion system outer membrane ring subunit SctC [Microbulbifer sp. TRSA007]|uniref:type III secretion system outer membrane ring subunit SctC n=1 Tax=Microbulbifer sp. TRSA007 TaxID=3243384 RepID=UPI00403A14D9
MNLLRHNFILLMAIFFSHLFSGANAQTLMGESFEFYGEEQPLRDVLTAIATHSRLGVEINEGIDSDFSGYLMKANSKEALNFLAGAFDLVWYFDGATLYIDPINEMESKLFLLSKVDSSLLKKTMQELSIWDERFEWRSLGANGIVMVSGPPRYLELVDKTVEMLNERVSAEINDELVIQIYGLKYASAIDRKVTARDQEVVLPGVATLLRGLIGSDSALEATTGRSTSAHRREETLTDSELTAGKPLSLRAGDILPESRSGYSSGASHPHATVYPDPSTNSVIVQDYASRLLLYENLITQLDRPREQLEISLVIIDLTTNSLRELGVHWNVDAVSKGSGLLDLILPGDSLTGDSFFTETNADFLATVRALESEGKARVTSRPAVVTENGTEALLDNSETFFVRIQGERVATLEQITFGTLLKVVPRVVEGASVMGDRALISLDVQIEDANRLADGGVDSIPSIRNTLINTRSSVPNGGSLLIGGYYREATTSNTEGVPFLAELPLLGGLFKRNDDTQSQLVRLFMLSPRILPNALFDSSFSQKKESLEDDHRLNKFANVSNYNPDIHQLGLTGLCESALEARQRRNSFRSVKLSTRIVPCEDTDGESYRVVTIN